MHWLQHVTMSDSVCRTIANRLVPIERAVDLRWDKLPACHCFQLVIATSLSLLPGNIALPSVDARLEAWRSVSRALMNRVAGAGLSGAKEAPGFRAGTLQPRPPINPLLTEYTSPCGIQTKPRTGNNNTIRLSPFGCPIHATQWRKRMRDNRMKRTENPARASPAIQRRA